MAELTPSGGGSNRPFIVLALGLGGLLILGLIGLGGFFVLQSLTGPRVAPTPRLVLATPTRISLFAATPTAPSTDTPSPTLVVVAPTQGPTGSPTATVIGGGAETPRSPGTGQLPRSGLGEDLLLLAGGVVLGLIIFAARRARTTRVA